MHRLDEQYRGVFQSLGELRNALIELPDGETKNEILKLYQGLGSAVYSDDRMELFLAQVTQLLKLLHELQ